MRQVGDELTTRELHMILVANGHLYYSVASNWGTAHDGNDRPFDRFRAVSPWADVEQAIGVNCARVRDARQANESALRLGPPARSNAAIPLPGITSRPH